MGGWWTLHQCLPLGGGGLETVSAIRVLRLATTMFSIGRHGKFGTDRTTRPLQFAASGIGDRVGDVTAANHRVGNGRENLIQVSQFPC